MRPGRKRHRLQVDLAAAAEACAPPRRHLSTPECMSSPVSHLRELTHDLDEGAKRSRAAQYLRETREAYLRQRRLYLVLDLDETLVHAVRTSVRQASDAPDGGDGPERQHAAVEAEQASEGGAGTGECYGRRASRPEQARGPPGRRASCLTRALPSEESESDSNDVQGMKQGEEEFESESDRQDGSEGDDGAQREADAPASSHLAQLPSSSLSSTDARGHDGPVAPAAAQARAQSASQADALTEQVTLRVQNVEFEMILRPGVHSFLHEMSSLFAIHLYTMGSREYVRQALHYLDPTHTIFKPGQVLAWNPALDRTTKTLQRLLCVPELVLIVDDSPAAWSLHLANLILIDRFIGNPEDTSLRRIAQQLKTIHRSFFEGYSSPQFQPALHLSPLPESPSPKDASDLSSFRLDAPCESSALPDDSRAPSDTLEPARQPGLLLIDTRSCPDVADGAVGSSLLALDHDWPLAEPLPAAAVQTQDSGSAAHSERQSAQQPSLQSLDSPPTSEAIMTKLDVRAVLHSMCCHVLRGVHCAFLGPVDLLSAEEAPPPEVQLAQRFGATFYSSVEASLTHLLVPNTMEELECERTSRLIAQARDLDMLRNLAILDARWLLDSIALCERLPEDEYRVCTA